jgi:hypothetical protein
LAAGNAKKKKKIKQEVKIRDLLKKKKNQEISGFSHAEYDSWNKSI